MRFLSSCVLLLALFLGLEKAYSQVTQYPYVNERYTRSTRITRVELTDEYTIIDMQYGNPASRQLFRLPIPGTGGQISIDPESRLYKPGVTSRKYKFIRAEGIPLAPDYMAVAPNQVVNFRLFYERLDPGITIFDFYEGRNPDQVEYWNFYGVHITNPYNERPEPKQSIPPPARKSEPKPNVEEPVITSEPAKEVPPAPEIVGLTGTVFDASTKRAIPARLVYVEEGDSIQTTTPSGKYRMGLSGSRQYAISVGAKGYLGAALNVNPADSVGKTALQYDFYLTPIAEGTNVALNKIYFATSEYTLLPESYNELDGLVTMLRVNPSMRIRIEGHTDNLGDFDKNVELSRNRAEAVRKYLISKGISANRLEAKGYGPTRPISKGNREEERQKNRRVEFVVLQA